MKRNPGPKYWPDHLHPVFAAIGTATAGKRLHPDIIGRITIERDGLLADHNVTVERLSGEAAKPGGNRYEIAIKGPRILG
jgi:hypothetical protein